MNVQIVVTQHCSHCRNLEQELQDLGVDYQVLYVEEHPEVVNKFGIRHSPNVVVDERIIFRGQPTEAQLRQLLKLN